MSKAEGGRDEEQKRQVEVKLKVEEVKNKNEKCKMKNQELRKLKQNRIEIKNCYYLLTAH